MPMIQCLASSVHIFKEVYLYSQLVNFDLISCKSIKIHVMLNLLSAAVVIDTYRVETISKWVIGQTLRTDCCLPLGFIFC